MENPQPDLDTSETPLDTSTNEVEFFIMPNGELVEIHNGVITSVMSQDGKLIEEPTHPQRLKSSSVAGNFFRIATNSVYLGSEQRPGSSI